MHEQATVNNETNRTSRHSYFFSTILCLSVLDLVFLCWTISPHPAFGYSFGPAADARSTKQRSADSNPVNWQNDTAKPSPLGKSVASRSRRPLTPTRDM
jgi:hypothetical protein